jgi:hypothetical protein
VFIGKTKLLANAEECVVEAHYAPGFCVGDGV